MKKLDIGFINSHAPYVVKEDLQEGVYNFFADSGAELNGCPYSHERWG